MVSHVTPIKLILRDALAAGDAFLHRLFLDPAGISIVDFWPDGGVAVRTVNDTAHLDRLRQLVGRPMRRSEGAPSRSTAMAPVDGQLRHQPRGDPPAHPVRVKCRPSLRIAESVDGPGELAVRADPAG